MACGGVLTTKRLTTLLYQETIDFPNTAIEAVRSGLEPLMAAILARLRDRAACYRLTQEIEDKQKLADQLLSFMIAAHCFFENLEIKPPEVHGFEKIFCQLRADILVNPMPLFYCSPAGINAADVKYHSSIKAPIAQAPACVVMADEAQQNGLARMYLSEATDK